MIDSSRVGRLMAGPILAIVLGTVAVAPATQSDPFGEFFCNGGPAIQLPIGLGPPGPVTSTSCVATLIDDWTVVGGQGDGRCNVPAASSMQQGGTAGYADTTANIAIGPGAFGTLADVSVHAHPYNSTGSIARTYGYVADTVTVNGGTGSGTLVIPVHLTGSSYVIGTRLAGAPDPVVHAGISVVCILSLPIPATCDGGPATIMDFSDQANLPNEPTPVDTTVQMRIPLQFGTPIGFALYTCSVANLLVPFYSPQPEGAQFDGAVSVDFSHTGVIEKATVLDGDGQEVPGATIESASGFDYLNPGGSTTTTSTTTSTTGSSTTTASSTTTSTSVTTTSTSAKTTTTTTLPGSCAVAPTFDSIDCRLDALRAMVAASSDLGTLKATLLGLLGRAQARKEHAAMLVGAGKVRPAKESLKQAIRAVVSFQARVQSLTGRKQIGGGTRALLIGEVGPILDDMRRLAASPTLDLRVQRHRKRR